MKRSFQLILAHVQGPRTAAKYAQTDWLTKEYLSRASRLADVESCAFRAEKALLGGVDRREGRVPSFLILFDSCGELMPSESFAGMLGQLRDQGTQRVFLAVGPPDGWSRESLARANRVISLGRMTLPHELARVVVAEQIYRALTILAGHPYHCGH